jgi:hypothetical protein
VKRRKSFIPTFVRGNGQDDDASVTDVSFQDEDASVSEIGMLDLHDHHQHSSDILN